MMMNQELNLVTSLRTGERVELMLYPALEEAIECGWESLYFASNNYIFATAKTKDIFVSLVTHGDVLITNEETQDYLNGDDETQIRQLIESGQLFELDCLEIVDYNSFELEYNTVLSTNEVDGIETYSVLEGDRFQANPTSIEEFIQCFLSIIQDRCH